MIQNDVLPLDELLPDTANYNRHSPENVALLASQILAVGFTAPFLVDAKTRMIAAGHRRRLALLKLREEGHPEPDGVQPGWCVPCRVGEWTELQRLKVLIGDNVDPARLDYDGERLTELLGVLAEQGELGGSGYSDERLAELVEELAAEQAGAGRGSGAGVDPNSEWDGMPEFVQDDMTPHRTLHVHFADEAAVQDFQRLIEQEFSPEARYIFHPRQARESFTGLRYADEP